MPAANSDTSQPGNTPYNLWHGADWDTATFTSSKSEMVVSPLAPRTVDLQFENQAPMDPTLMALEEVLDLTTQAAHAIVGALPQNYTRQQQVSELVWSSYKEVWDSTRVQDGASFEAVTSLTHPVHLQPISDCLWRVAKGWSIDSHRFDSSLGSLDPHERASRYLARAAFLILSENHSVRTNRAVVEPVVQRIFSLWKDASLHESIRRLVENLGVTSEISTR